MTPKKNRPDPKPAHKDASPSIDLPPPETQRWVVRRKAAVVEAVRQGVISLEDACAMYRLSREEFDSWVRLIDNHGPRGLRVTRLKSYRR